MASPRTPSPRPAPRHGGVTSILSYFRTGGNYLGKNGPYRELLPEILAAVEGHSHVDYGFHLAPMTQDHLDEVGWLAGEEGITSFKYYLYMKGLNLTGSSTKGSDYSMTEDYDLGHLFDLMERVTVADALTRPNQRVSVSLHCESAELIRLFLERCATLDLPPLEHHSRSRPPVSERLSVHEVGVLADETQAWINLLHLSSAQAIRACRELRQLYPALDVRFETTSHHLTLTHHECEFLGARGKVNPPLRADEDRDALWRAVRDGTIDWVASDHACCLEENKLDIETAVPGYGGTAMLWPAILTEGRRRQVPIERLVDLLTGGLARAFGCYPTKARWRSAPTPTSPSSTWKPNTRSPPRSSRPAQDFTPTSGGRSRVGRRRRSCEARSSTPTVTSRARRRDGSSTGHSVPARPPRSVPDQPPGWWIDETVYAGPEHLDAGYVTGYAAEGRLRPGG